MPVEIFDILIRLDVNNQLYDQFMNTISLLHMIILKSLLCFVNWSINSLPLK